MEYKKIDVNEKIKFIQKTENYGIAYFDFCFKINEKGKIEKVFISPHQQPDKKYGWEIEVAISSGYHIETRNPEYKSIWRNIHGFYCKHHKSLSISVACPENTSSLYCDHIGGDIWFKFE